MDKLCSTDRYKMRELSDTPHISCYTLAPSFEHVREWCWRLNIDVRNVRYIFDRRDVAGADNYTLIMFDAIETHDKYGSSTIALIRSRASTVKSNYDVPIVQNGRIVGWK